MFANVSAGADRKANTSEAAAHFRLVMFVSLTMAASAVAPLAPMLLTFTASVARTSEPPRLRAGGRIGTVRE